MSWPTVSFLEVLEDVTGGNEKTKQSDYLAAGHYPIVDQGQSLIGGYTDDETRLCKTEGPVIVFGDHTKALKFIDFPFCLGADGTKVLRAKANAHPKYLYYALQGVHIPEAGYSRHFKYLKAGNIPLPPLEEQKRIAATLDQADALRRLRARALDKLNTLGQAIFHEMFGDVVSNSKDLPKARVGDHCERVSVGVVVKPASYYQEAGIPALRGTNIKQTGINLDDVVYFSREDSDGPLRKSRINTGDVLAVRSGRPGLAAVVPEELDGANCIDVLIATTKLETLLPEFLRDFLNSTDGRRLILAGSVGQVQQHFNVKSLSNAEIPLPQIGLQREYLKRMSELDAQRKKVKQSSSMYSALFASLQQRAFRGEL